MAEYEMPGPRADANDRLASLVRAGGRRVEPPREAYELVRAVAERRWRQAVRRRQRRNWLVAVAAALALAFVVVPVLLSRLQLPTQEAARLSRGRVEVRAPGDSQWRSVDIGTQLIHGMSVRTTGESGAVLRLASGATLRVRNSSSVAFVSGARLQLESGSVFIDSDAAQNTGVAIETRYGVVRDVGTLFEVESSTEALRVRVRDGRVRLEMSEQRIESAAGEELTVNRAGTVERRAVPTWGSQWAWTETLAVAPAIDGKPLLQFLEWVARETGRPLRFVEPESRKRAASVLLHGSVPDARPMEALELVLAATDFEYALEEDGGILIHWRAS